MSESKLESAIAEANANLESQGVKVTGGKKYLMVKDRVIIFRKHYGDTWGIETKVVEVNPTNVVVQATIINEDGVRIGSGLAEEERDTRGVNATSALENAETSAIGRALASLGLHGGEYASADEMVQAITQQKSRPKATGRTSTTEYDEDWKNAVVPNGKNAGKALGELGEKSLMWYIETWQPWRGKDGDLEPKEEHIKFRSALDSAKKAVFSDGEEIQPLDVEVRNNGTDASASVEDEQTNEMRPDDEGEEVPF
jgi:hypothetical protein